MDKFNLNIDNYNIVELKNLLNLRDKPTFEEINFSTENLKEKLVKENGLDPESKQNITFFLDNIRNKLCNSINCNSNLDEISISKTTQQNYIQEHGNNFLIKDRDFYNNNTNLNNNNITQTLSVNAKPRGIINPIKIKTITKNLNIDSRFRSDYYNTKSSDFTISLPEKINKISSMKIKSAEIPTTFYAISPKLNNTTFTVTIDGSKNTITLPEGNYECKFLDKTKAAFIEDAINDELDKKINNKLGGEKLRYTVDIVSCKSVFAYDVNAGIPSRDFTINFNVDNDGNIDNSQPLMFHLGWLLGFRAATYTGRTAISESICLVSGPRYLFIAINDYQNNSSNSFTAAFSESILSPNIMERITLSNLIGSSNRIYLLGDVNGSSNNSKREYFGPVDIQRITISIYDEYGRIVDLNGMDWSLLLEFECIYD